MWRSWPREQQAITPDALRLTHDEPRITFHVLRFALPLGLALALVVAVGCGGGAGPVGSSPANTGGSSSAQVVNAVTPLATPRPRATPTIKLTPTITQTSTVTETPTTTDTPGPPTATPTPAPDASTVEAAQTLDQALVAFAQAAASGDSQKTLDTQQKLLTAAQTASTTANADQSNYGQQLRSAIQSAQAAAGGSNDGLNAAHKLLVQLAGPSLTTTTPLAAIPQLGNQNQASLPDLAQQLQRAVTAYNNAQANGNQSDVLAAQRDLIVATNAADAATKNNHSPLAQQIQTALSQVHDGLGGDSGKFAAAAATLGALTNQNGNGLNVSPTPTFTASPLPTPSPSPTVARDTQVDLQPLQNDLDNKLQMLQTESTDTNKANVEQAEAAVRDSIQKASDAVANDQSPAAQHFRDALGTAGNAANGDFSKIQSARDQLRAAVGQ
jgi:hypothetical protein